MFKRESTERFRPYERIYVRDEKRRMENERFNYHSEPEVSFGDDDDLDDFSEYESDWEAYDERRPVRRTEFSHVALHVNLGVELFFKNQTKCLYAKLTGGEW